MFNLSKFVCIVFGAAVLVTGCKGKDGEPGPAGPGLTGNLNGFATTYDEAGVATAKAGTTVTVDNQTPALTATTDADGRFQFAGLKAGTYNFTYSRTGYGTMKRFGVGHVGGDQPTYLGNQGMSAVATPSITGFNFGSSSSNSYIPFSISLNMASPSGRVIVFFGNTNSVSSANFSSSTSAYSNSGNGSLMTGTANKSTLNSFGMASGTTAYAIAYSTPANLFAYSDPATGRMVYPSLGAPSSVQAFIVP